MDLAFGWQPIEHRRPTDLVSVNIALKGALFSGRVIHATFESQGAVWIYTRGVGSATGVGRALNNAVGLGPAFGMMHYSIQQYLMEGRPR